MGLLVFLVIILVSGVVLVTGLITALVANSKGYRPWFWILSMGPIGLIIMMVKQSLNQATTPEERERWESQADWTGGVLSGLTFMTVFGLPVLGAAAFLSARGVAFPAPPIAPPPPVVAPPQVVVPEVAPPAGDEAEIDVPAQATPAEQPDGSGSTSNGNPKSPG